MQIMQSESKRIFPYGYVINGETKIMPKGGCMCRLVFYMFQAYWQLKRKNSEIFNPKKYGLGEIQLNIVDVFEPFDRQFFHF